MMELRKGITIPRILINSEWFDSGVEGRSDRDSQSTLSMALASVHSSGAGRVHGLQEQRQDAQAE